MIARISGILLEATFTEAIIDVHGIGYLVNIPMSTYDKLPQPGNEVVLFTVMAVREDDISLYGFAGREEKQLYEVAISVNGIGPKLAMTIISSLPVHSFCHAINNGDLNLLKKISGIGKRTAERLLVELKGKLDHIVPAITLPTAAQLPPTAQAAAEDAVLALERLGFKRDRIDKAIQKLLTELDPKQCSAENLIRKALQTLNSSVS